jgi:hypothetical protein
MERTLDLPMFYWPFLQEKFFVARRVIRKFDKVIRRDFDQWS